MFSLNKSYHKIRHDLGLLFLMKDRQSSSFVPVWKTFGFWFGTYWPEKDGDV